MKKAKDPRDGPPAERRSEHPLVATTRRELSKADRRSLMLVYSSVPHLDLTVSADCLERGLAFWDSLITTCLAKGWKVSVDPERLGKTVVVVDGERLALRVRETYRQIPFVPTTEEMRKEKRERDSSLWPKLRYLTTGLLEFTVREGSRDDLRLRDGKNRIDPTVLPPSLRAIAAKRRADREWREQREKERLEALRQREEAERQRAEEERRRTDLLREVQGWSQATTLRAYILAIRERAGTNQTDEATLEAWMAWAETVAESLDPVLRRIGRTT